MSISNTSRIMYRGKTETIRFKMFADQAQTIPLEPLSPDYPSYAIKDIAGTTIQSGVAIQDGNVGNWKVEFAVPEDAPLSSSNQRWRFEATIVTPENRQVEESFDFDMVDMTVSATDSREQTFIGLEGRPYRAIFTVTDEPYNITMTVINANAPSDILVTETSKTALKHIVNEDKHIYYHDFTLPSMGGSMVQELAYIILWSVQETVSDAPEQEFQKLNVLPWLALQWLPDIRLFIDKFQKRLGRVQAYEDSDIYYYLVKGLQMVNGWQPTTEPGYSLMTLPSTLKHFVSLASGWWGLTSQQLLEVDLGFDFSGQTVSLSYDRASQLDSVSGRFIDFMNEHLAKAKTEAKRRRTPAGFFMGRPLGRRRIVSQTYRIASTRGGASIYGNNYLSMLQGFGLLP